MRLEATPPRAYRRTTTNWSATTPGGIDPNYQHPEYMALPLAESIRYAHYEIAELLLQNGADPLIVEAESRATPLQTASNRKQLHFVELLKAYVMRAE